MSPFDRQTWSKEHTEQGESRHTVPKDLQRFKRCKTKEDPTDQELLELCNLPGRNTSNSTLKLQIKGLSRYPPTYSDEELETKRIARLSNPDDQASCEAEDRYIKKKRKYKKMIAIFAERMQELIAITLPFADAQWTASDITLWLPTNVTFYNLHGGLFHGQRARTIIYCGDESGNNLSDHEDPDMTEIRLKVASVTNSDGSLTGPAFSPWRTYFDWNPCLEPPHDMEHCGINKVELRDIEKHNTTWTDQIYTLPLNYTSSSDNCQRHRRYYNDCTFVIQQANKGNISRGLAYASIMGGNPGDFFNLYTTHDNTSPSPQHSWLRHHQYSIDNDFYRPMIEGLPTTINQVEFADLKGTKSDHSAITDLMSKHMLLTFCKLTLAGTSNIFLDSQVYMTRQSPVEQFRLGLEDDQREEIFGFYEEDPSQAPYSDANPQLVTPYTGISIHLNQDLVKGNIFEKDLGRSDSSCAPVTLLDPGEIFNRLTENWRYGVSTDLLPTKDNMDIDIGKNSAAFDVDKKYEDLILRLGSLVVDDEGAQRLLRDRRISRLLSRHPHTLQLRGGTVQRCILHQ